MRNRFVFVTVVSVDDHRGFLQVMGVPAARFAFRIAVFLSPVFHLFAGQIVVKIVMNEVPFDTVFDLFDP